MDFRKIDIRKNAVFIIERLFEWGDLEEVRWLQQAYSLLLLKEVIQKSRNVSPKKCSLLGFAFISSGKKFKMSSETINKKYDSGSGLE